jgi:hypothetical protein
MVLTHKLKHALVIDARRAGLFSTTARQCSDASVAVSWEARYVGLDFLDRFRVVGRFGATTMLPIGRASLFRCYTKARHAENFADRLHWLSPAEWASAQSGFLGGPIPRLLSGFDFRCLLYGRLRLAKDLLRSRTDIGCGFMFGPCRSMPAGPNGIRSLNPHFCHGP